MLNKLALEQSIKVVLDSMSNRTASPAQARADFAKDLASAIDVFVRTGQVAPGQTVQVAPSTGTGATTSPGTII